MTAVEGLRLGRRQLLLLGGLTLGAAATAGSARQAPAAAAADPWRRLAFVPLVGARFRVDGGSDVVLDQVRDLAKVGEDGEVFSLLFRPLGQVPSEGPVVLGEPLPAPLALTLHPVGRKGRLEAVVDRRTAPAPRTGART